MSKRDAAAGVTGKPVEETMSEDDLMDAIDAAIAVGDKAGDAHARETAAMPTARDTGLHPSGDAKPPEARVASTKLLPQHAVELLSKVNIFAGLPPVYLKRIAALCHEETYQTGKLLFREGDAGDKLYLILEGAVRIGRQVPGMGEEALAVLKAGDYFGEMALIDDFPRSADAVSHDTCRVIAIGKEKLRDLMFVDRDLAYDLLWTFVRTLSGRLRQTNDKMTFMAVTSKF